MDAERTATTAIEMLILAASGSGSATDARVGRLVETRLEAFTEGGRAIAALRQDSPSPEAEATARSLVVRAITADPDFARILERLVNTDRDSAGVTPATAGVTPPLGAPGDGGWAAAGVTLPNAAYRNQTLRYEPVELGFDESVPFNTLLQMAFNAALAALGVWVIVFLLIFTTSQDSGGMFGEVDDFFGAAGGAFGWAFLAFWVIFLSEGKDEPISEWKSLIEDRGDAAELAYAAIQGSLSRRRIPLGSSPERVRSDLGPEIVSHRLVIGYGPYIAYVTVFAYGTSLYLGWTMWRRRTGISFVATFWKDVLGGLLGRTGTANQMLRTEGARAMREAVHSAVREGVEAVATSLDRPAAATFGAAPPPGRTTPPAFPIPPAPLRPAAEPHMPPGPPSPPTPPSPSGPSAHPTSSG
ncbi:hypothetical protein ACWGCP_25405 [Streptomyces niveus]